MGSACAHERERLADVCRSVLIWRDFKSVVKIEAHDQAVWAVKFVGEDRVLTGKSHLL